MISASVMEGLMIKSLNMSANILMTLELAIDY